MEQQVISSRKEKNNHKRLGNDGFVLLLPGVFVDYNYKIPIYPQMLCYKGIRIDVIISPASWKGLVGDINIGNNIC